jgi:hypothetical protein
MDTISHKHLTSSSIPTIYVETTKYRKYTHIGILKALSSLCIVELGYNVIFSEFDVFWAGDPLKHINDDYDHFFSEHSYCPEVNIGFYVSKSNTNTINFYETILKWMMTHLDFDTRIGAADQKIYDYALRGISALIPEGMPYIPQKWTRLPHAIYWHNMGDDWTRETNSSRLTYHLSFGIGSPINRIEVAKQMGLWIYST